MKLNGRGLIATIIYHVLLLLLLIFAGLTYPVPPPEEEGILVNFGTEKTGSGNMEPSGDDQQAGDPELPVVEESREIPEAEAEPVRDVAEETMEVAKTVTPPDPKPEAQTQDVEETKVKEVPGPTPEELEQQRQAELERERQAEVERQRLEQERIERERREEEERIAREKREEEERIARERQQQAEKINNMGRNAFGRQGEGTEEGSEGITEGSGNQGVTSGTPGADRYDTGGGLGDGISFGGLGSRRGSLPKPDLSGCGDVNQRIEVMVDIQVDRNGTVVSAIVGSGTTYQDKCIWDMVVAAARASSFSPDQDADYRQSGWIKYIIEP